MKPSQEVVIAGQRIRVQSTASEGELERLAAMVTEEIRRVLPPGRPLTMNAALLAALSLAHAVDEERTARASLERTTRDVVRRVLVRLDGVLDEPEDDGPAAGGSR